MSIVELASGKYSVRIRKKGVNLSRQFETCEEAELFYLYKNGLIDKMETWEVPLKARTTMLELIGLKEQSIDPTNTRLLAEFRNTLIKYFSFFHVDKYYHTITYEDWVEFAKFLLTIDVWHGSKTNLKKMSIPTLRRVFAILSSAVSHAQSMSIDIDNLPLKVLQTYITPMIKKNDITDADEI